MSALPWIVGLGAVAALAVSMANKKEKGTGGVEKPDYGQGEDFQIPTLKPPRTLSVPFGTIEESVPEVFTPKGKIDMLPAVFADYTFLFTPEVEADYLNIAGALAQRGNKDAVAYAQQRILDFKNPVYYRTLQFDDNLPASHRSAAFWYWLAHEFDILENFLNSADMAPYPLFRDSVWACLKDTIYNGRPAPWGGSGQGAASKSGGGEIIDSAEKTGNPGELPDQTGTKGPPYYVQGPSGQRFDTPPSPDSAGAGNVWVWKTQTGTWVAEPYAPSGNELNLPEDKDPGQPGGGGEQSAFDKAKDFIGEHLGDFIPEF